MEKLQAALEKARNRREAEEHAAAPRAAANARPTAGRVKQLWHNLPEIALSGKALHDHHVVAQKASQKATPFDILRTKVLLQMRQNHWNSMAITSPMPRSGKTTMACNLALGLGRQSGLRTILFDLDLKDPSIGDFLDHRPEHCITEMLSGDVSFADQAVRIGDNVAVCMARHREEDPTRILLSGQTAETLAAIKATYEPDVMIFDTPSILIGDNTRAFLRNVDCALIVARANNTRYGHFDACEREIAEYTNVLGVVLNAFRTKEVDSYIE